MANETERLHGGSSNRSMDTHAPLILVARWSLTGLPVSTVGVHIQLCCGVTLAAWAMIALFGSLGTSGLRLTTAFSMGACLSAGWVNDTIH